MEEKEVIKALRQVKEVFDKYGDSIIITIYDSKLKEQYIKQIKNTYLKSLKDK